MIFFVGNGGTIVKGLPEPVYQGAANANTVYLVAPFASNGTVTVAFQLPNGTATAPAQMAAQGEISGITDESGAAYSGWLYDLPNAVTALYGVVTAQFYFYNAQGKITASSATSFTVGRGVPAVLPDEPSEDVYEQLLSNIAALQTDLNNGFYAARAIYAWNSTYTYGANEITYYPVGTYGAFVKSVVANNIGQTPYVDGAINSAYWEEVVSFDELHDLTSEAGGYVQQAKEYAEQAEDAIDVIASYLKNAVLFVPELPATGEEGILYAVVSESSTYLFTLYIWENGGWSAPLGTASLDPNYSYYKVYPQTLPAAAWSGNQQTVTISGLTDNAIVQIFPTDASAAAYAQAGISVTQNGSVLTFTCETVPTANLSITVWRTGYTLTATVTTEENAAGGTTYTIDI